MGLYTEIAEHATAERNQEVDTAAFADFLSDADLGNDPDWRQIDDAIDRLVQRFKEREYSSDPVIAQALKYNLPSVGRSIPHAR